MKLNFKEWNIILKALHEQADSCKSCMSYYSEDDETYKDHANRFAELNSIIGKIENISF